MEGPASNSLNGDFAPSPSEGEVFAAPDNLHIAIPHLQSTLAGEAGVIPSSCACSGSVRMSHTPSWGRCGASSPKSGWPCQGAALPVACTFARIGDSCTGPALMPVTPAHLLQQSPPTDCMRPCPVQHLGSSCCIMPELRRACIPVCVSHRPTLAACCSQLYSLTAHDPATCSFWLPLDSQLADGRARGRSCGLQPGARHAAAASARTGAARAAGRPRAAHAQRGGAMRADAGSPAGTAARARARAGGAAEQGTGVGEVEPGTGQQRWL